MTSGYRDRRLRQAPIRTLKSALLDNVLVLDTDRNTLGTHVFRRRNTQHRLQHNVHKPHDKDQEAGENAELAGAIDAGADKSVD